VAIQQRQLTGASHQRGAALAGIAARRGRLRRASKPRGTGQIGSQHVTIPRRELSDAGQGFDQQIEGILPRRLGQP